MHNKINKPIFNILLKCVMDLLVHNLNYLPFHFHKTHTIPYSVRNVKSAELYNTNPWPRTNEKNNKRPEFTLYDSKYANAICVSAV